MQLELPDSYWQIIDPPEVRDLRTVLNEVLRRIDGPAYAADHSRVFQDLLTEVFSLLSKELRDELLQKLLTTLNAQIEEREKGRRDYETANFMLDQVRSYTYYFHRFERILRERGFDREPCVRDFLKFYNAQLDRVDPAVTGSYAILKEAYNHFLMTGLNNGIPTALFICINTLHFVDPEKARQFLDILFEPIPQEERKEKKPCSPPPPELRFEQLFIGTYGGVQGCSLFDERLKQWRQSGSQKLADIPKS